MDAPLDLTTASREALLEFITQLQSTLTEQEAVIAQLQRRTAELEARLNTRGPLACQAINPPPGHEHPEKKDERGGSTVSPGGGWLQRSPPEAESMRWRSAQTAGLS